MDFLAGVHDVKCTKKNDLGSSSFLNNVFAST